MRIADVLDLINKDKRISARTAATKKIGIAALIAAGAGVGVTGIVFAVRLKRKIWPKSPKTASNHREKGGCS